MKEKITRYSVYKAEKEFNYKEIHPYCTYETNADAGTIISFNTLKEAEEYLKKNDYKSRVVWVSGYKYKFEEYYIMREEWNEEYEEWCQDFTNGPFAVSDFYDAKVDLMHDRYELSYAGEGEEVDLEDINNQLETVPDNGMIYIPITENEGYLYHIKPNYDNEGELLSVTITDLDERASDPYKS